MERFMSTSVSDERDASRDSGPAPEEPVVVSANDARQGLPAATCSSSGIWDHRRDFRARGGSGLYRAASTMELSKPLASAVHLQTMSEPTLSNRRSWADRFRTDLH